MAQAPELYCREMHNGLGFWATWLPGALVKLGDCGTIDDFSFSRRTTLSAFGIEFAEREAESPGPLKHSSGTGVSVDFHAAGRAATDDVPGLPSGEAGVTVGFAREAGVVFAATGTNQAEIEDIAKLERDLKIAYLERGYPENYVVVTAVVTADSSTVLVSRAQNANVTLSASADLTDLIDLARVNAGLRVMHSRGLATQYLAEGEMTPLFKVMGFKQHWFKRTPTGELQDLGSDEPELQEGELRLGDADFEEYAREHGQP